MKTMVLNKKWTPSAFNTKENTLGQISLQLHFYVLLLLLAQSIPVTIYRYLYSPIVFTWINLAEIGVFLLALFLYYKKRNNLSLNVAAFGIPVIYIYLTFFLQALPVKHAFVSSFWYVLVYMFVYLLLIRSERIRIAYLLFCLLLFFIPGVIGSYTSYGIFIKIIQICTFTFFPLIISSFLERQDARITNLNNNLQHRLNEKERITLALKQKNEELVLFSQIMSHDLKSPLRNIRSFATLLKRELPLERPIEKEYFKFIEDSAEQMDILINDLLTYTKIEIDEKSFSPVPLDELVEDIKDRFQYENQQEQVNFNISTLPTIIGDRSLLKTLFQNLISNGVKFQPKNCEDHIPSMVFSCHENEEDYHIYVADNGIGIHP